MNIYDALRALATPGGIQNAQVCDEIKELIQSLQDANAFGTIGSRDYDTEADHHEHTRVKVYLDNGSYGGWRGPGYRPDQGIRIREFIWACSECKANMSPGGPEQEIVNP